MIINKHVLSNIQHPTSNIQHPTSNIQPHGTAFRTAKPFRHVVIDDFFEPAVAEALLAQFPAFEVGNARSENGDLGNKSTVELIRELGPHMQLAHRSAIGCQPDEVGYAAIQPLRYL